MATEHGVHTRLYIIECQKTHAGQVTRYIATEAKQTGHAADAILLGGPKVVGTVFNDLDLAYDHLIDVRLNGFIHARIVKLGQKSGISIDCWRYNWYINNGTMLTMCLKED